MARKLRIPRLEPKGLHAEVIHSVDLRKRTDRKPDAERLADEPWRAGGYGAGYRRARQQVIARQLGRCAHCGTVAAFEDEAGKWVCKGGSVHHVEPLCDGGTNDPSNLVLLCNSCHGFADAKRRSATP